MPALPTVAKVIRVDLLFSHGANTRIRDRIFLLYTGAGPSSADLITLATTIRNGWATNLAPQTVIPVSLIGINLTDLTTNSSPQVFTTQSAAGTNAGTAANAGFSIIIKFKIARRYRGGHPRFYMPGPPNVQLVTSTTFVASYVTAVASGFTAFIAACVLAPPASFGTLTHANVSYFQGFTNVTFPSGRTRAVPRLRALPVVDIITSYSVNPIVAQQRRRNQQSP